ncbi:uncharacterized protein LOC62_05G007014 [Vanrija pseudolonga]|uniref:DUF6534 domain-containing protein n=1 Tax=Vanrija pseudolonga TaxID=143232 RepID=A0AAF0YB22_9TREE|nr:hypothetical protein LOC62_05G007014 [Vanrija pseudolonga]
MSSSPDEVAAAAPFAAHRRFWLGCFQAQVIIDTFLCGVFTVQLTQYWEWQSKDRLWTRLVVITTAFLAYFITGFIMWNSSYDFVAHYGLYAQFFKGSVISWYGFFNAITCVTTQGFFAHRAFHLTNRSYFVLGLVWVLILTTLGATLAIKVLESVGHSLSSTEVKIPVIIYMASTVCADFILTVTILYCLLQSKTGWDYTDKVIMRLVRMTVESQLPPTILAVVTLSIFSRYPDSALSVMLQVIQSKFYCIGLMYSLNTRIRFTPQTMESATGQVFTLNSRPLATIQVDVETETYETHVEYLPAGPNRRKLNKLQMDDDIDEEGEGDGGARASHAVDTDKASGATGTTDATFTGHEYGDDGAPDNIEVFNRLSCIASGTPPPPPKDAPAVL